MATPTIPLLFSLLLAALQNPTPPEIQPATAVAGERIVQDFKIPFVPEGAFRLILSSELMAEPIPGINWVGEPACIASGNPVGDWKRGSRTQRIYEFQFRRECPETLLKFQYLSQAPKIALTYPIQIKHPNGDIESFITIHPAPTRALNCFQKNRTLSCSALDSFGNLTNEEVSLKTLEKTHTFQSILNLPLPEWLNTHALLPYTFQKQQFYAAASPRKNQKIWFGDLHFHSRLSDARIPVSPQETLTYARDVSRLDFAALTDHTEGVFSSPLTPEDIQEIRQAGEEVAQPGVFSVLEGYEWTSTWEDPNNPAGHRVVLSPNTGTPWFRSDLEESDTVAELARLCNDCLFIPHHTMMPWGAFRFEGEPVPQERILEVFSTHGNFEKPQKAGHGILNLVADGSLQNALRKGWKGRWAANSDNHCGHPGLNDWKAFFRGKVTPLVTPELLDGGGLIAIESPENSPKHLLEALHQGHFYATTGTRILLEPQDWEKPFPMLITGTAPLRQIHVVELDRNGHFYEQSLLQDFSDTAGILNRRIHPRISSTTTAFYVRVEQWDEELAWIGPFFVPNGQ